MSTQHMRAKSRPEHIDSAESSQHSVGMNGGRIPLRSAWRCVAVASVLLWVSAFSLCTAHCSLGKSAPFNAGHVDEDAPPPCHGGPAKPDSKAPSSFCFTMKSLFAQVSSPESAAPDASAAFLPLLPIAFSEARASAPLCARFVRQSCASEWVFTPEVSLGPAFRAHAPPVLL